MMSSANAAFGNGSRRRSIGLAALLMISSLAGIMFVPTVSANVNGDYEITSSISPKPGDYITSWDPLTLEVEVTNSGFFSNSQPRTIEWFVCEGVQDAESCFNSRDGFGTGSIEPISIGSNLTYTFNQKYNPNGNEGEFTLVYRFIDSDNNNSNDIGIYNFNLVQNLVDFQVQPQDPISKLQGLATYDGELILNTDTDYNTSINAIVTSCLSCNLVADIGWRIIDSSGVERANSSLPVNISTSTTIALKSQLPPINFNSEGKYTFVFGLFNSSGTPYGDMNSYNDQQSVEIIFDDSVDLQITSMYPLKSPNSDKYFYGNDSVSVTISNLGNHSVVEPLVRFIVMNLTGQIQSQEDCNPIVIEPASSTLCIFDINHLGDKKLRVFVSDSLNEGVDVKPSDNIINVISEVIAGEINPTIEQSNFRGIYKTADLINFTANVDLTAAGPLTYSWWLSGIFPLGTGQSIQVPAATIGLGDHFIAVRATDALGTLESTSTQITVFNSTDIGIGDWLNGSAVTRTHATINAEYDYPSLGVNYLTGNNLDALIRISMEVVSTSTEEPDPGMDWMEFDINLSKIIPDNVPRESVAIHKLMDFEQGTWEILGQENKFTLIDNNTLRVNITQNMNLLIVGELPPTNVSAGDLELTKLPDGKMRLDWSPSGDLDSPYLGGWNVYRITSPITASAYFPSPETVTSEFVWSGLMQDSLSASLTANTDTWVDNRELENGLCASYALIPYDRTFESNHLEATVTRVDGSPGLTCGDAIDPTSEVSGLRSSVVYNNDTDCYDLFVDWNRCYEVTLTWTWPDHETEGNITWNLYRVEKRPTDVDLRFIEPIASGLINEPGESGTLTQYGTEFDGIMPMRTYYYILTPLDHIGNELTIVDYPSNNVERVYVEDQYWEYNQDRIPTPPEPPEPPYGVEWLGDLEEYMKNDIFQIAGIVMLLTVVINFIGLPLVLKKRKRMSRVLARRAGKNIGNDTDDFEDFFN